MDTSSDPLIGSTLGDFRINRLVGRGGMGTVYAATQLSLGREVALKVMAPRFAHDPEFRRRFTREAQAMAALDSPHVVHVHTYGEDEGQLYLVSQLVPGGDLGQLLRESGVPPLAVGCELIAQVADGLADAHAAGLVHRDIKLANVLVRPTQRGHVAYLADFGIARSADAAEVTHTGTVGTPSYMAPELHLGQPPGVLSDVYALGCLLWAVLTGEPPYPGATDYAVADAHINDPVPQLPGSTERVAAVNAVLRRAMAKRPADRPGSAAEFRAELLAAVRAPDIADAPTLPLDSQPSDARRRSRRRSLVAALVVAVLVVGGGTAWLALGDDSPAPGTASSGSKEREDPVEPEETEEPEGPDETEDPGSTKLPRLGPGTSELRSFTDATSGTPEQNAVDNMTEALASETLMERDQARCVAEAWLEEVGMEAMVQAGYLDEQGGFHDQDLSTVDPKFQLALNVATAGCLLR